MKTVKAHLKVVALFFSVLILLQGCTVYKSANVTLDEAVRAETKVKIIKKNDEKVKYFRVIFEDGQYKSIKKLDGGTVKTHLDIDDIEKVQVKDKVLSTIMSIGIPLIFIVGLAAVSMGATSISTGF